MTRFVAQLMNEKFINIHADRLEEDVDNNLLIAYDGKSIVACVDKSVILTAYISEKEGVV